MKKSIIKKTLTAVLALSFVFASLAGCGEAKETNAPAANEETGVATEEPAAAEETAAEVKTYRIATEGAYAPFNYIGEDGQPDGFDIAVAKAVDELLPDVEFTYEAVEWSSIFVGLEAERYDLIVSQIMRNPDREAKYLFSEVPYSYDLGSIAFKKGRDDIKTMEDLKGKSVVVGVGSSYANDIETWNADNGNEVIINYGDGDVTKALLEVQEGRSDATLMSPVTGSKIITEQGLDIDFVLRGDQEAIPTYWLFAKSDKNEELIPKVDEALKQLIESGKLGEISEEYLGGDYTTLEAVKERIPK
ncbi:MAG: transporter substrate-binding domain-containing protein [Lachnospiraceae bacterium]|nr:transporter substrate-binding domain-containing protein [Lachnospiraceae bacterium]